MIEVRACASHEEVRDALNAISHYFGQENQLDMKDDPNGGFGGFMAMLPAQQDGALYYQIVACDAAGTKCAVSTGGRRKWHTVAVSSDPARPRPAPLDTPSKAPASVP